MAAAWWRLVSVASGCGPSARDKSVKERESKKSEAVRVGRAVIGTRVSSWSCVAALKGLLLSHEAVVRTPEKNEFEKKGTARITVTRPRDRVPSDAEVLSVPSVAPSSLRGILTQAHNRCKYFSDSISKVLIASWMASNTQIGSTNYRYSHISTLAL